MSNFPKGIEYLMTLFNREENAGRSFVKRLDDFKYVQKSILEIPHDMPTEDTLFVIIELTRMPFGSPENEVAAIKSHSPELIRSVRQHAVEFYFLDVHHDGKHPQIREIESAYEILRLGRELRAERQRVIDEGTRALPGDGVEREG